LGCGAAAFLVAFAGCGGDPSGPGDATVILEDDFSSGDLSKWIVTGGDPAVDASQGNPVPSVFLFKAANSSPGDALRANTNFTPNGGLTFTADVRNLATAGEGQLTLWLRTSNGTNTCQAVAQIYRTHVLYENTNGFSRPLANNPITADDAWHTYSLVIGTDGAMSWYRDGSVQLSSPAYSGCTADINVMSLDLSGGGTPDESNGNVDNVRITRP
jgi:hypothetical protein